MGTRSTYQVIQELGHHESDVKAVLALDKDARLACASRDGLISLWKRQPSDNGRPYVFEAPFRGHDAYVNSLAHIPYEDGESLGWLASGGNSTIILIHSLDTMQDEPTSALIGHTHNVCALFYSPPRKLLASASWDCTARIWKRNGDDWVCAQVLQGHQQAVWDVKVVPDDSWQGRFITASGESGVHVFTYIKRAGISGCGALREKLCSGSSAAQNRFEAWLCSPRGRWPARQTTGGQGSPTASNFSVIRVWSEGEVIASLLGHTDYIYQVAATERGLVSCGEDQTSVGARQ